jgi:hypothetical protein
MPRLDATKATGDDFLAQVTREHMSSRSLSIRRFSLCSHSRLRAACLLTHHVPGGQSFLDPGAGAYSIQPGEGGEN